MHTAIRQCLLWIGTVLAVGLPAGRALPCSPQACLDPHFYPEEIRSIPTNAPGPVFFPPIAWSQQVTALEALSFQWLDEEGNPVPHRAVVDQGVVVLVPDGDLQADAVYTVDYPNDCQGLVQRRTFLASAAGEWPCEVPPVVATPSAVAPLVVQDFTGACAQTIDAAVSRLEVSPFHPFVAWASVLRMRTTVDGEAWALSEPGLLRDGHEELPMNLLDPHGGRRADLLYARCAGPGGVDTGLEAGAHRVRVEFLLPGHETGIAAPEFDVTLTCETEAVGEDVSPCTGGSDGCVATTNPGHAGGWGVLWGVAFLLAATGAARRSWGV